MFVSDELPHYGTVLRELFHKLWPAERTGKPGRPRGPERKLDGDLVYATVRKERSGSRVVKVERSVELGTREQVDLALAESPSRTINTAYVERANLGWRHWDAHLTRKAMTFAKSKKWLEAKFAISVAFYNLIRPHGTLSRSPGQPFRPKTPAMAAGITSRPWAVRDLLGYQKLRQ